MDERSIGGRLAEVLSNDQVLHLLDMALMLLGKERMHELLSAVDGDVASTVARLLGPQAPLGERVVSNDKLMEEWAGLWEQWDEIIGELGDEKGRYAEQDHHWEAPYFAAGILCEDLDEVAERMLPLLEKVHEIGEEEGDVFERALLRMDRGIDGYPSWMGAEETECDLGPPTTRCVLSWGRLNAGSAAELVKTTVELEDRLKTIGMSHAETVDFFRSLPEGERREVYSYIDRHRQEAPWRERLNSTYSKWHQIYYDFLRTLDPGRYLDDCRKLLHNDCRYGFPLIEHLVSCGKYAEAEDIAEQTAASLVKAPFEPEQSLLISISNVMASHTPSREEVLGLLKDWMTIADKLNRKERAASLQFQLVTYETPEDWDRVVECLRRLNGPRVAQTVARLVEQWRDYILCAQLGRGAGNRGRDADCWPMWLLEAGLDEAADGAGFIMKTNVWLSSVLQMTAAQFKGQQNLLTMLICDLMDFHEPAAEYRRLREAICRSVDDSRPSTASRRAWLQKLEAGGLAGRVIQCWTKHIVHLVPDPAQAESSDYTYHVRWLAALCELDSSGYRKLLNRWKELHKRRRNLWKSIQEHRLPL